jgi:hypothetical protein
MAVSVSGKSSVGFFGRPEAREQKYILVTLMKKIRDFPRRVGSQPLDALPGAVIQRPCGITDGRITQ